jgi:hypothetical protein
MRRSDMQTRTQFVSFPISDSSSPAPPNGPTAVLGSARSAMWREGMADRDPGGTPRPRVRPQRLRVTGPSEGTSDRVGTQRFSVRPCNAARSANPGSVATDRRKLQQRSPVRTDLGAPFA